MFLDATSIASAGRWWGYAEADPTIVGAVVVALVALAVAFVIGRALSSRRSGVQAGGAARRTRRGGGAPDSTARQPERSTDSRG